MPSMQDILGMRSMANTPYNPLLIGVQLGQGIAQAQADKERTQAATEGQKYENRIKAINLQDLMKAQGFKDSLAKDMQAWLAQPNPQAPVPGTGSPGTPEQPGQVLHDRGPAPQPTPAIPPTPPRMVDVPKPVFQTSQGTLSQYPFESMQFNQQQSKLGLDHIKEVSEMFKGLTPTVAKNVLAAWKEQSKGTPDEKLANAFEFNDEGKVVTINGPDGRPAFTKVTTDDGKEHLYPVKQAKMDMNSLKDRALHAPTAEERQAARETYNARLSDMINAGVIAGEARAKAYAGARQVLAVNVGKGEDLAKPTTLAEVMKHPNDYISPQTPQYKAWGKNIDYKRANDNFSHSVDGYSKNLEDLIKKYAPDITNRPQFMAHNTIASIGGSGMLSTIKNQYSELLMEQAKQGTGSLGVAGATKSGYDAFNNIDANMPLDEAMKYFYQARKASKIRNAAIDKTTNDLRMTFMKSGAPKYAEPGTGTPPPAQDSGDVTIKEGDYIDDDYEVREVNP